MNDSPDKLIAVRVAADVFSLLKWEADLRDMTLTELFSKVVVPEWLYRDLVVPRKSGKDLPSIPLHKP
jgi:hypothetical protein